MTKFSNWTRVFGSIFFTCQSSFANAQGHGSQSGNDFLTYQPTVQATRISREEAPKIDGEVSEDIWKSAQPIDEFYQINPKVGDAPSEKTQVSILYDDKNLYVAVEAFDARPEKIRATILERDGDVWRDDMVRFYIDPFNTGISGFGFDVNALGARADRLVQANRRPVDEWDVIWDSAGKITETGWTAEFILPFQSISFDPNSEGWGLMITREISHKNEEVRWAGIDRSVNKFGFERPGYLTGISDINPGIGLDVELLATAGFSRDWPSPQTDSFSLSPSANITYKFTPSLTGLLTLKSDFSDTPLDTRQINTGRFSLFFPETRDFFLQDAAFFEFGGEIFNGAPNGRPFFSRRIGIVEGQALTIDAGTKLSGEYAGFDLGLLTVLMENTANIRSQSLSVARGTRQLSHNLRLGFMATHGTPDGRQNNTLFGVDSLYKHPNFLEVGQLQVDGYYQRTLSSDVVDDDSFGVRAELPSDKWDVSIGAKEIGADFQPELGFVNRAGIRDYMANWRRRHRTTKYGLRYYEYGTSHNIITDLSDELETRETSLNLGLQTQGTDTLDLDVFEVYEKNSTPFTLPGGIIVPAGDYHNDGTSLQLETSRVRPYGALIALDAQSYFGGSRRKGSITLLARPSPLLDFRGTYSQERISVRAGDVTIHIGSFDTVLNLSPDLSISTQSQFDNISKGFSFFGRLRWEMRPETEILVSVGHGAIIDSEEFSRNVQPIQSQSIFRIGNTFRF